VTDKKKLAASDFVVISAVNDIDILNNCLARSEDIRNGDLKLITIDGATSMAQAYNDGLDRTDAPIVLFAHQDIYLPRGWLDRALAVLEALTRAHPDWRVAGPYGVQPDGVHAGRVWDVTMGRELGTAGFASAPVGALDELLLILRNDGSYRFDADLPHFHLYGTDVVQQALADNRSAWAVELPLVHNNRPIESLRGGYASAYTYMRRKWRRHLPIPTAVCTLSRNPARLWRAQWRRRRVVARPTGLLADAVTVARNAGYE
jgi:hypothetical protein